jgi:hypothetical protein
VQNLEFKAQYHKKLIIIIKYNGRNNVYAHLLTQLCAFWGDNPKQRRAMGGKLFFVCLGGTGTSTEGLTQEPCL